MQNKYTFRVGDEVITDDGRVGKIATICKCDRCETRGFYELSVDFGTGYNNYITHWDYEDGFSGYYKIGDYVFGNLDLETVENHISKIEEALVRSHAQRDVILKLLGEM